MGDQAGHGQRPARDRGELAHELDVQSRRLGAVQVWRGLPRESRGLPAVLRLLLVAERWVALRPAPGCRVVRRAVLLGAGWRRRLEELRLLHELQPLAYSSLGVASAWPPPSLVLQLSMDSSLPRPSSRRPLLLRQVLRQHREASLRAFGLEFLC